MQVRFQLIRFTLINSILFSLLILVGCQKEKSLETGGAGNGSTAVFTLVASGSDCSDATATGTFVVGTTTTATDFVLVTVNVTKAGTWNYSTGTPLNGLTFSGSGTFPGTGMQAIALKASGKPIAVGNTTFPLNIGGVTCSFTVTINASGGNPNPGDPYYKATINGVNYMATVTGTNEYEAGSGLGGSDDVVFGGGINYANPPIPAGFTQMSVDKGIMHGYLSATDAQFKAFFPVGDHSYTPPTGNLSSNPFTNGNGVVVYWTDNQGNYWSSSHASQSQPAGSTFKIISVEDAYDLTGTYYIKVKMQFNCTLFKDGSTETATLTNGEMVAYFGKI